MRINAWLELRDTFDFPGSDPELDTELQAKNRETLSKAIDRTVVTNLFRVRTQGPRSFSVYLLTYDVPTRKDFETAIERFASENPGGTKVLGAWHLEDGRQVGIEADGSGVPLYPIAGNLISFMPDVDDVGTRPAVVSDVNLLFGQAHRDFS